MLAKRIFYQELVSNAVKILTLLIFLLPVTELFKLLEAGGTNNIPSSTLAALMLYGTIASFPMILTIACFLSVVITINRYCKESEFAVWLSSGISPFFWLRSVSFFAIPFAIFCAISTMYVTPWATNKRIQYMDYLYKQQTKILLSPGIFREDSNKNIFYLDHYSFISGYAKKIFIQYVDAEGVTYNVTASEGKVVSTNGLTSLILKNARRYQILGTTNQTYNKIDLYFDELVASVKQNYTASNLQRGSIDTLTIENLVKNIRNNNKESLHAKAELSWRISIAAMLFVMVFIAVPISIQLGRVQGNLVFIVPPLIYAAYNNIILTLNGYLNQGKISSILTVQMVHIALLMAGILLTYYKMYPKGHLTKRRIVNK